MISDCQEEGNFQTTDQGFFGQRERAQRNKET
jgi:hypothetical protein